MPVSRRQIVRTCKARGWQIQPDALKGVEVYLQDHNAIDDDLLDALAEQLGDSGNKRTVTSDIWQAFLREDEELAKTEKGKQSATSNPWTDLEVVSAFRDVRLVYQTMKKHFQVEEQPWSLFGKAEDKIDMHVQRYALTHQRLLRHELFRQSDLGHMGTDNAPLQYKLTPIETLLGRQKRQTQKTLLLLGLLQQVEEGQYYLEDLTGQVPISFEYATVVEGFFVTEGNILLVEGSFQDGILYAQRVGHPLLEERDASLSVIQQQVRHPAFTPPYDSLESDAPMVLLSDVHLDQPRVLQQLEALFARYDTYEPSRLPLFCLMGNFCSQFQLHAGDQLRQSLEELASLIGKFRNLADNAQFVLVPGPNDGVGHVLPYSWPKSLSDMACWNKVAHAHLTSNPSRIRWKGRSTVLFRYNVLSLMQQRQIPLPFAEGSEDITKVPHLRLVKTLLDQGHLLPMSDTPIYWNYDHAFRLYPLPDSLVLGSSDATAFHENYGGVNVIHPGSFVQEGEFAQFARVDDDDEAEDISPVQFHRMDENWATQTGVNSKD